ncbi:hypothetical protein IFM89_027108 [Coptis chinensis]|uniref:Uncharacterized protein n=1 Tax=Coptis chinensis TaxID=261450 RepID=A0A835H999_9MAGN|nr:hypothetical protein IFM89_027108 [Coptis chinensis]
MWKSLISSLGDWSLSIPSSKAPTNCVIKWRTTLGKKSNELFTVCLHGCAMAFTLWIYLHLPKLGPRRVDDKNFPWFLRWSEFHRKSTRGNTWESKLVNKKLFFGNVLKVPEDVKARPAIRAALEEEKGETEQNLNFNIMDVLFESRQKLQFDQIMVEPSVKRKCSIITGDTWQDSGEEDFEIGDSADLRLMSSSYGNSDILNGSQPNPEEGVGLHLIPRLSDFKTYIAI